MPRFLKVAQIWGSKRVIAQVFFMLCAGSSLAVTPIPPDRHELGLLANSQIAGWINNEFAQVKAGQEALLVAPVRLNFPGIKFANIASGSRHSLAIDETGKVWVWGDNSSGQLGLGHTRPIADPTVIANLPGQAIQVVAGAQHSAALMAGGTVWVWGGNQQGQNGNGTIDAFAVQATPARLTGLSRVLGLASGDNFVLALAEDVTQTITGKRDKGTARTVIWAWGSGQARPGMVDGIKNVESIRAAGDIAMARTATGGYWRWQANQAPSFTQRQAFDSLGVMALPVMAALDTQTKTKIQPKLAATATAPAKVVVNNSPASAVAVAGAGAGAGAGAAQQFAPPAATPPVVATVAVAVPQFATPAVTVVAPLSATIVATPATPAPPAAAGASAAPVVIATAKVSLSGNVRLSSVFGGDGSRATGASMENVQVSAEGAQCSATDSQGRYSCIAPAGWSGRVSLRRKNYRFTPSSLSFENLRTDAGGQDFAAVYEPR